MNPTRSWKFLVALGTLAAAAGLANTVRNLRIMRSPPDPPYTHRCVSVLLPLRNESDRVTPCLQSLLDQSFDELLILDDASEDDTAKVVTRLVGSDPRVRLISADDEPPPGWLGKPWACQRLADSARGDILLFVDADVVLANGAVDRVAALLDSADLSVICPYPRQQATGPLGRLIQPLLQWSWLTTLPLDIAESSTRPTTAAGNGQLLAVDATSYRQIGGHGAVRGEVLEDIALVRTLKSHGGRGGMADGTTVATCTMYNTDAELVAGYTKSLWAAFGSPLGAVGAMGMLLVTYVVPPLAIIMGPSAAVRLIGVTGYGAAVTGRWLIARRTGQRQLPDVWAHPASVLALVALVGESFRRRRRGALTWRGRPVVAVLADSELGVR